jgi:hypothetical protein
MSKTLKVASSIEDNKSVISPDHLAQFTGTTQWYQHWLEKFTYTDGVKYLADEAKAYWLLDAIASHQTMLLLSDEMLREFQIWILKVNLEDKTAKLICERDTDDVALTQEIDYTTFPLAEVKLYLSNEVLMLTSEY